MTVRDLIEALENYPQQAPVVIDSTEVEQVVLRTEIYYSDEYGYNEGQVVKLY